MKIASFPAVAPPWLSYGLLYFLSAYFGFFLATIEGIVSPAWFAAGFALAGVLLHGYRVLPGIWIGSSAAAILSGVAPLAAAVMALGAILEAFAAAFLLRRVAPADKLLLRSQHLALLLLIGFLLTPTASAVIGSLTLTVSGLIPPESLPESVLTWWVGDATGSILIAPLVLAWVTQRGMLLPRQWLELALLLLLTLLVCGAVFGSILPEQFHHYPVSYLPFPLLVWTALRFRHRATTSVLLLIACCALLGTYRGFGPFVRQDLNQTLLLLQLYVATMTAMILFVSAIIAERQQALSRLALAGKVITHSPDGIIVTDPAGIVLSANPAFFKSSGLERNHVIGKSLRQLTSTHHTPDFFSNIWQQLKTSGHWEGEVWSRNQTGAILPQWLSLNIIRDSKGSTVNYLGIYSDASRQKQVQERIRRLAYYDVLTGLPNRQLFTDRLDQAIKYAGRHNSRLALFFLDLDRFKNINDTLGHSIGDKVLQLCTERLSKSVRQTDTLARLGGDEFTVIVQDINEDFDSVLVAEKVINAFSKPLQVEQHELFVTPSIGISLFPEDGNSCEELIKHADTAMYRAKELGGNGFQFFATDMSDPIRWNLTVENALRHAIDQDAIQVVYQPQFDLRSGAIVGLEALARWHHKGLDETPPSVFIRVAEETGLIHRLGELILRIACRQAVRWRDDGIANLRVAVNISPLQLKQDDFARHLRNIVETSGASPNQIELEITESTLMENAELMESLLTMFSAQGFQIAVDDFGTGYSSLSYLRRLAIDRIKIDQSFVRQIPEDSNDAAICSAIISMAHNLRLRVIAEGVENEQQMDFLRRERCDEIQGYIFSRPVSPDEVAEMIRQGYWHTE